MNHLSLRDKIGQMLIVGFEGKTVTKDALIVQQIQDYHLGGVILFDYHFPSKTFDKNIESPAQVRQLNADLQRFCSIATEQHQRLALPLLIAVDYEGGRVNRLKESYGFPKTMTAEDIGQMSTASAEKIARDMAITVKNNGFNLNFVPVLDVNTNPENPILGQLQRCFSQDAMEVARFGRIFVEQFRAEHIQTACKHFPGHGSSTADSHLGFVDVTDTWRSEELLPYQLLIEANIGCDMIMTAHIVNRQLDASGLPATLSYPILTELLRNELQFDGIIITDDMQMKAISMQYGMEEALVLAVNAGADMFIFGNQLVDTPADPKEIIDIIEANVQRGVISRERIEDAYRRIVTFKKSLGSVDG